MVRKKPDPTQINGLAVLIAIAAVLIAIFSFVAVKLAG
jgi:hypothetical protein